MRDRADVRAKVSTKLRAMQWKPVSRGGNGKPIPVEQQLLAAALGWKTEVAIATYARNSGYPTCYKLDIANRDLFIGVEVDGGSHTSLLRMAQDEKKMRFLKTRGWKILRFKNKEVAQDLAGCVRKVLALIS